GITRDRISGVCTRGDKSFAIWDTGGVLGGGEKDLVLDVERTAQSALRDSDIALFMVDARAGLSPIDQELARMLRRSRKTVVLVINKVDNDKQEALAADFDSLGFDWNVSISAEHNRGVSELLDILDQILPEASKDARPGPVAHQDTSAIAIVGRPNV